MEDKATYHGRRHDFVMYTNRRVKSRDLTNIANKRLKDAGKRLIKSDYCLQSLQTKEYPIRTGIAAYWERAHVFQKTTKS